MNNALKHYSTLLHIFKLLRIFAFHVRLLGKQESAKQRIAREKARLTSEQPETDVPDPAGDVEEAGANHFETVDTENAFYRDTQCSAKNLQPLLQQPGGALASFRSSAAMILLRELQWNQEGRIEDNAAEWENALQSCWLAEALSTGMFFKVRSSVYLSAGFVKYAIIAWPLKEVEESMYVLAHQAALWLISL